MRRAERALALAGRALDANAPGGPDLGLAALLLRDALEACGAALGAARRDDLAALIDALAEAGHLERACGSTARGRDILGALTAPASSARSLGEVEITIAKLAEAARGQRRLLAAVKLRRYTFLALVVTVLSIVFGVSYARRGRWAKYKWRASSASEGFALEGVLGERGPYELVLHTDTQTDPWVEIDLLDTRAIKSIVVKNRADCCHDRGVPLVVEVAGEDLVWREVGRREKSFDVFRARFELQPARWVRLRAEGRTVMHYRAIEIR